MGLDVPAIAHSRVGAGADFAAFDARDRNFPAIARMARAEVFLRLKKN
jgi:hypothetical protein